MSTVDTFGERPSPVPRRRIFPAFPIITILLVSVLAVRLALLPGVWTPIERSVEQRARGYDFGGEAACERLSGAPMGSAEGTCTRYSPRFHNVTTFIVVNSGAELEMPEYSVIVASTQTKATRIRGGGEPGEYAGGVGYLMSFEITVFNKTSHPVDFGSGPAHPQGPHFEPEPLTVEMDLPAMSRPGEEIGYAPLLSGHRAPQPEALGPIPADATRTGWVTFVVGSEALRTKSLPGARLDFLPLNGASGYTGQIRI